MSLLFEFLEFRDQLIDRLESGEISKQAFIEISHDYIEEMNIKPFSLKGDIAVEAAICNYQYYNIKAKKSIMDSNLYYEIDRRRSKRAFDEAMELYEKKEKVVMELLEIIEYKNVEAYDIEMKSASLSGSIYEVVLTNYKRAVFHMLDKKVKNRLASRGLFSATERASIISDYVDRSY